MYNAFMSEKAHIEELCDLYTDMLGNIFMEAVNKYYDVHRVDLLDISPISKASLINDYIFSGLKSQFQDIEGFEFIQRGNSRFVGFKNEILIRIKKISNRTKRPSVNRTMASLRFDTQQDMQLLDDKATNVYLGYFLSQESGDIEVITFLCPDKEGNIAWKINPFERKHQMLLDFTIDAPKTRTRRISAKTSEVKHLAVNSK